MIFYLKVKYRIKRIKERVNHFMSHSLESWKVLTIKTSKLIEILALSYFRIQMIKVTFPKFPNRYFQMTSSYSLITLSTSKIFGLVNESIRFELVKLSFRKWVQTSLQFLKKLVIQENKVKLLFDIRLKKQYLLYWKMDSNKYFW